MGRHDKQKKKPDIKYRELTASMISDLIVGIILLILDRLFNLAGESESPSLNKI